MCACVCVCACLCVYIYTCIYTHIWGNTCKTSYINVNIYIYIDIHCRHKKL